MKDYLELSFIIEKTIMPLEERMNEGQGTLIEECLAMALEECPKNNDEIKK
jgi:hypothetical protein